ncbi:MAG: AAA family ATPase [Pseudomonadota bacterium]
MQRKKALKRYLKIDLPQNQSLFLWGARKTGKSTFLKNNFQVSLYYDFLIHNNYLNYSINPSVLREEIQYHFAKGINKPIIIDEVQKIPGILDEVHWMIENLGVSFILCGSSLRRLKHTGANLLGGRAWRQLFFPLVYPEFSKLDLLRIFNNGLIPSYWPEILTEVHPLFRGDARVAITQRQSAILIVVDAQF